jgi:hypothetical protein
MRRVIANRTTCSKVQNSISNLRKTGFSELACWDDSTLSRRSLQFSFHPKKKNTEKQRLLCYGGGYKKWTFHIP